MSDRFDWWIYKWLSPQFQVLWWSLALLLFLLAFKVWGGMQEQSPVQQSLPGYVMKVDLWQDSTSTSSTTSWEAPVPPDSIIVTLYRQITKTIGDSLVTGQDSTVAVYRVFRDYGR